MRRTRLNWQTERYAMRAVCRRARAFTRAGSVYDRPEPRDRTGIDTGCRRRAAPRRLSSRGNFTRSPSDAAECRSGGVGSLATASGRAKEIAVLRITVSIISDAYAMRLIPARIRDAVTAPPATGDMRYRTRRTRRRPRRPGTARGSPKTVDSGSSHAVEATASPQTSTSMIASRVDAAIRAPVGHRMRAHGLRTS